MENKETTQDGKEITHTEHPDGRKDVNIKVKSLDVDLKDPRNAHAKKVIESKVLPKVGEKTVTCTLIHKPTNAHFSFVCKRKNVLTYSKQLITEHAGTKELTEEILKDFVQVENEGGGMIKVTSIPV